jgi:hypothetical protein
MGSFLNGGLLALTLAVHWSSLSLCKEMAALPMGQARERRLVELNVVESCLNLFKVCSLGVVLASSHVYWCS